MNEIHGLLRAIDASGAPYVIVGGVAVVLQGHLRATIDVDVVTDLSSPDASLLLEALAAAGLVPTVPVSATDLLDPSIRASWIEGKGMRVLSFHDPRNPLRRVDVFVEEPIPFAELSARAEVIGTRDGSVRVASIDDLLAMKRTAGRPRDLEDIENLEHLRSTRGRDA